MPSRKHEFPIELVQHRPDIAPVLLASADPDAAVPDHSDAHLECADLAELYPVPYAADTVVVLRNPAGEPVLGIVVEVQLAYKDEKLYSWPVYQANLRARLWCPVEVVALIPDTTVARRYAHPIRTDLRKSVVHPKILGPDRVPVVTDPERAEGMPELAVLSALAHGESAGVLEAFAHALGVVDERRGTFYYDYVVEALAPAARKHWEALMAAGTYEWKTDFAREYIAKGEARGEARGEAKGEASAVLEFLDARGISVSEEVRRRVMECGDVDRLKVWVRRAATVSTAEELFE